MGKTFLKVLAVFILGAGCYIGFVPLFILGQKYSPVSHDWILDIPADMQVYAVYGQKFVTELVVAVPLTAVAGICSGLIAGYGEMKYSLSVCFGMLGSYISFFFSRGRWNEPPWFYITEIFVWIILLLTATAIGVKVRRPGAGQILPPEKPGDSFDDVYLP